MALAYCRAHTSPSVRPAARARELSPVISVLEDVAEVGPRALPSLRPSGRPCLSSPSAGGVTPSYGHAAESYRHAADRSIPLMATLRWHIQPRTVHYGPYISQARGTPCLDRMVSTACRS